MFSVAPKKTQLLLAGGRGSPRSQWVCGRGPHVTGTLMLITRVPLNNVLVPLSSPPSEGSNLTPAHHYPDFRFKTYAPVAFRYFRELFGIRPDDYLVSEFVGACTRKGLLVYERDGY